MFTTILIQPIYNVFVLLVDVMPHGDAGLAIISLTVLMRLILYPLFTASIRTQIGMSAMQPELDSAVEKYKNDQDTLGKVRMELLKKYKVNPFAGIGAVIVQFALIISLYYALFREGWPVINHALLYSFVHAPVVVSTSFFGIVDLLAPHHWVLSILVAITQGVAIWLTTARMPQPGANASKDKVAAARMQQQMMLYVLPIVMAVVSWTFAGAVGIYFVTGNSFSVFQEYLVRRRLLRKIAQ
jgi:YidC/Oxa1 family membrane protein insertase